LIQQALVLCRWLGIDRIFLTENAATPGTELVGSPAIQNFTSNGFLQLESEPRPQAQLKVYAKCIRELRPKYNWIAFFDLDEFMAVRDKCVSLADAAVRLTLPRGNMSLLSDVQTGNLEHCQT
jgi:hypothetical protein